jgi:hypothetical protein
MKPRPPFLTPILAVLLGLALLGPTAACILPGPEFGHGDGHEHDRDREHEHDRDHEHERPQ